MLPTAAAITIVLLVVGIHFEALDLATRTMARLPGWRRYRVALGILIALAGHFLEVLVFSVGWVVLLDLGAELSLTEPSFEDLVYFSGVVYTSLGFGDIVPLGAGRLFAAVEAVTGLVLIAWTASFSYFEMRDNW